MLRRPKVSVCIPSYNHARYLPATIESVLAQTFRDFEIVIVDDGSSDDSLQIAESYMSRYPSLIRVVTHPGKRNMGIGKTVNRAFSESRGEYFCGLPSDDLCCQDKLEAQVSFLEKNSDVDWVYGYAEFINEEGVPLPETSLFGIDITVTPDPLESLIQRNAVPGMTVLVRRESWGRSGPEDEGLIYSDWEHWIRLLANTKAAFLHRPLVLYRTHSHNASIGINGQVNTRRSLEVMRVIKGKSPAIGGRLLRPRTQALLDMQLSYYLFCINDETEARRNLMAAFETDPTLKRDPGYFADWLRERMYDSRAAFAPDAAEHGFVLWVLSNLPEGVEASFKRRVVAVDFARSAFESYKRDARLTRRMALKCLKNDPRWVKQKYLVSIFLESLIGRGAINRLRKLKRSVFNRHALESIERPDQSAGIH